MTLKVVDFKNLEIGDIEIGAVLKTDEKRGKAGSVIIKKSLISSEGLEKAVRKLEALNRALQAFE